MQYTTLGNSGLVVSRLGVGCMSYGSNAWRPWVLDEAVLWRGWFKSWELPC